MIGAYMPKVWCKAFHSIFRSCLQVSLFQRMLSVRLSNGTRPDCFPRQRPRQLKRGVYGCIPVQTGWSKLPQSAPEGGAEGGPGGGAPPEQVFGELPPSHWESSPSTHPFDRAQQGSPAKPQGPSTSGGRVHTPLDTTRSTMFAGSKSGGVPSCLHAGLSA